MNSIKLKKKATFSLIALLWCSTMLYSANNTFNITGYIGRQVESIKEKEMKYVYNQNDSLGDRYLQNYKINVDSGVSQVIYSDAVNRTTAGDYYKPGYAFLDRYGISGAGRTDITGNLRDMAGMLRINSISEDIKAQVNVDSCRDKLFGAYYVFSFDYTMNALTDLENSIDRISEAQKVPKALLTAVLFREMMFLGQEDLLDGLPVVGGKSMGICQIGIENARYNEQIVHGENSLITSESDEQIKAMLQNPKHAVYFCAVQLKARAIKLTGNHEIDLNKLSEEQLKKVLENYNLSSIPVNIGPVKTKEKYAEETFRYYELFQQYYRLLND